MKLTVTQEKLARALGTVGRVASAKTSLPILGNILLRAENNRLLLAATNLEIAITEYVGGKVDQEGGFTVPARLMSEFITSLPAGNVDMMLEGTTLHIKSGGYSSKINGMHADEFPDLPGIEAMTELEVDAKLLKRAIQQVVLVASHDDTRPTLTGVYWHSHEGALYMAATDGYRLAERRLLDTFEGEVAAIIPASALAEVVRALSDDVAMVAILLDETQVRLRLGDVEITSKLIDGKYVDYRQLVPTSSDTVVEIDKQDFIRITKVASLFARESGGGVTIDAVHDDAAVRIHSIASQLGENTSEANAQVTSDGKVTLNSRYLIEGLGCIDDSPVTFSFSGKLAACILRAKNDQGYMHIIMPLKS
ncbi:DNA polymerase III subunit beta [Candidatus Saccharibacteria bacterium]|nr:DNA polymerase III subunit beta [Candidatus Saccharibacteria bacterium]